MFTASDLRKGLRIKIDNEPYVIIEFNFVKPGKGQALYRTKLKNMINGNQFERTFRSVDTFESADLREKKMQYLYKEGDKYCFMDNENYEQVYLTEDQSMMPKFMTDNIEVEILLFEDKPIGISLPNFVELIVTEAEPWARGDTAAGSTKPVKVQTGYTIQVPTFVTEGEKSGLTHGRVSIVTRVKI